MLGFIDAVVLLFKTQEFLVSDHTCKIIIEKYLRILINHINKTLNVNKESSFFK